MEDEATEGRRESLFSYVFEYSWIPFFYTFLIPFEYFLLWLF
jgi:hypothetical protein